MFENIYGEGPGDVIAQIFCTRTNCTVVTQTWSRLLGPSLDQGCSERWLQVKVVSEQIVPKHVFKSDASCFVNDDEF